MSTTGDGAGHDQAYTQRLPPRAHVQRWMHGVCYLCHRLPRRGDHNQAVHGGWHGDYQPIVLAPASVQEAIDLTVLSFDLAEKYRSICMVILDGCIGQMMEPAQMPEMKT